MSTKNSMIVFAAVALLALIGIGAARFASPRTSNPNLAAAERLHDQMVLHSDALNDSPVQGIRAEALRVHDQMVLHSEALAGYTGSSYAELDFNARHADALAGGTGSSYAQLDFNARHADALAGDVSVSQQAILKAWDAKRAVIEQHSEALAR